MQAFRLVPVTALVGGLLATACGTPRREQAASEPQSWYRRATYLDLTGDGRQDSAVVVARGSRPDSLDVELTLFVAGVARHTEEWRSDYELIDVAPALRERPQLDRYMRDRLDQAVSSVQVEPLDTGTVREISDSPEVLEEINPLPTVQVVLAYGYETAMALAWDASRRRFAVLYACCRTSGCRRTRGSQSARDSIGVMLRRGIGTYWLQLARGVGRRQKDPACETAPDLEEGRPWNQAR